MAHPHSSLWSAFRGTTRILGENMEIRMDTDEILVDLDFVIQNFSRDELLSALGFDQPSDFLDEVTISDVGDYFSDNDLARLIDITDYWGAEDAVNRYDTELLNYFGGYTNTEDWGASDYIDNYGDAPYMLEVILNSYLKASDVHEIISSNFSPEYIQELLSKFGKPNKVKYSMLEALLKAQYSILKDVQ